MVLVGCAGGDGDGVCALLQEMLDDFAETAHIY